MQSVIAIPEDAMPIESFIGEVAALADSRDARNLKSCLKQSKSKREVKHIKLVGPLHNMTTFHNVRPYFEIYGAHPSTINYCHSERVSIS